MVARFAVFADGLEADLLEGLENRKRRQSAVRAINKIARDARADAAKRIREQVALPASYVSPAQKRLYVSQNATGSSLEARITARGRATSLARFAVGNPRPGKAGVYVEVAPGKARLMKRAFVMRLPQGNALTDSKFNLGLAIRLRPGERLSNKTKVRRIESGLYLLYGPSVSQVFRANDGEGVANEMVPEVANDLTAEFLRLLDL
tara:strand:- start:15572 stop:16189 length:618 start_codon:yes stop_codon:yes gene_type:complete